MQVSETCDANGIANFENLNSLLGHMYFELKVDPSQYSLLWSEHVQMNKQQRVDLAQNLFEKVKVGNFFLARSPILTCFSTGRATALVVDCGAS